tara:strand:+ start:1160 stop:4438 length:3279 start_codon:yes stop_codon:yes gene_type:complete
MLPQYEISGFLGRGGMGAVYRGRQIRLDRDVAIKVLPETLTQGGNDELKFAERFELEAQAMAKFSHSSIVSVFDFGETSNGQLYFVMEFVEGMDIHQYLRENGGSISQEYALSITAHVLDALDYAHTRGIIHRDIKPANILLNNEGQVKIADFGLAKVLTDGEDQDKPALTMSNVALGTPDFVAPEAIDGDGIPDHRADLYAVGVMLYQMLTGRIPRGKFPCPSELLPDLDPRVDDIVQQAMQYSPSDRYDTANSMRMALDPVISAPVSRVKTIQKGNTPVSKAEEKSVSPPRKTKKPGVAGKIYLIATVCAFSGILFFVLNPMRSEKEVPAAKPATTATTSEVTLPEVKADRENVQRLEPISKSEKKGETTPHPVATGTFIGASEASEATTESPYENSLGMRFAPVPITGGPTNGKLILFSTWETRLSDYRAFKAENPEIQQGETRFPQDDSHPAVYIGYENATAFCNWLTESEKAKGNLKDGQHYRLPTDHEWSCAIGIGELEDPDATPLSKDKALAKLWPWGDTWPPSDGTINCYGEENAGLELYGKPKDHLKNYSDGYRFTAPVDSMGAGKFGLYHMPGNIVEWTSDWSDESKTRRTFRSSAWLHIPGGFFMSSARGFPQANVAGEATGLRAVLDLNQNAPEVGPSIEVTTAPINSPQASGSKPAIAMEDAAPASPLALVPGLEPRLVEYLQYRQKLISDLSEKYLSALDRRFQAAIAAGDLTLAKAFESEKSSVEGFQSSLLELDKDPFSSIASSSTLDPLPAEAPQGLSNLRGIWITERKRISSLLSSYLIESLQALEVELTKAADLENASTVKNLKDSIGKDSSTPPLVPTNEAEMPSATLPDRIDPFENSIGMQFVPVQVGETTILVSVYETTVANYRSFLRIDRDRNWPEPEYRLRDKQAAVLMSWFDAEAFCQWLTNEERQKGLIGKNDTYTLPSLLELQTAAGLVRSYDKASGRTDYSSKYLWGDEWPIPGIVGNLYGEENSKGGTETMVAIAGYNDGETQIAEVGSYDPNKLGIYDLVGNAREWCSDWSNDDEVAKKLFGASWKAYEERRFTTGFRTFQAPSMGSTSNGFRVVLRRSPEI